MGKSWHNNHPAYPESAALGLFDYQPDPGCRMLNALANLGLAWNIVLPKDLSVISNLKALTVRAGSIDTKSPKLKKCKILEYIHQFPIWKSLR